MLKATSFISYPHLTKGNCNIIAFYMKENRVSVKKLEWTAYLKDLSNKMSQINFSGIANTNFH